MRRIGLIGLAVTGGLALAAGAGGWLWLQGDGGRHWLAGRLAAAASAPGAAVTIGGIEGSVPFAMTLTDVTVADHKGGWLAARRTVLSLEPGSLLSGTIDVRELVIDRLDMTRPPLPEPESAAAESQPPATPAVTAPAAPARPVLALPVFSLPVVIVHRLVVEEVALGAAVLGGEPALLHAEGHARLGERHRPQRADFDLTRRDGRPGSGQLRLAYTPDDDRLDLALALAEPAGGVLARALALTGLPALEVSVTGSAPLSDWRGRLTSSAGGRALLSAEATVRRVPGAHVITVNGGGDPTPVLKPSWATLIGKAPLLALEVLADDEGGLTLRPGSALTVAAGTLAAEGRLDPDSKRLTLRFKTAPVGSVLAAAGILPPRSRWRAATIEGAVEGSATAPALSLALTADEPAGGSLTARSVSARLRATPTATGPVLTLEAAVDYLTGADPTLTRLAGPHAQLSASGHLRPGGDEILLDQLALTLAAGKLSANGALSLRDGKARGKGRFAVDHLSRLLGPFGLPLAGIADLDVNFQTGRDGARFDISGSAGNLGTEVAVLDRGLTELFGDGVRVKGVVTVDGRGGLRARDWRLDGRLATVTGQADLIGQKLDVTAKLAVPQLAGLAGPLGFGTLAGAATLDAHLQGPVAAVDARAMLTVDDLVADGRRLGRTELEIAASGLTGKPKASLKLRALSGLADLAAVSASALLALGGDGKALELTGLTASQGDNRVSGFLRLGLDGGETTGHLTGQLPNLEMLEALAGAPVRGRGRFDLVLGRRGERLTLVAAGGANSFKLGTAGAAQVEFKSSLSAASPADLMAGQVTGSLSVTAQAVKAAGLDVASLTASAEGTPAQASFQASAPGASGIDLAGTLTRNAEGVQVKLARFAGRLGGQPVKLVRPAAVAVGADRLAVTELRLEGKGFSLMIDGSLAPGALKGRVEAHQLPLELLQGLSQGLTPSLPGGGRIDGEATLAGSLAEPRADITARFTDIGQAQAEAAGIATGGLGGSLEAHWRGSRLVVEGDARAKQGGADLHFTGDVPVALRLEPLGLDVPEGGTLRGTVKGKADLSTFNDLLAATGDRVAGAVTVDLTVGGTVAAPQLGGRVSVAEGRYENQASGSVIEHMTAQFAGNGQALTLEQFSGRTANGGTVSASGTVRPAAPGGEVFDIKLTARNARLLQTDMATAEVDADLTLTGGFKEARLAGEVLVQHADIRLPERLPAEVVDLKVVEMRTPPAQEQAQVPVSNGGAVVELPLPRRKPLPPGTVLRLNIPPAAKTAAVPPPAMGAAGLTLAIGVTAHSQVLVRGRGLDSEFSCALKVAGTLQAPSLRGTLTMLHGKLEILGKEFQFKRGTMEFAGEFSGGAAGGGDFNPDLDMLAEAKTSAIVAQAQLSGSVRAPRLLLTSVPAMPQDEVLSRLLFDKATSQLGPLEAVQLADSASQLTGIGGSAGLVDRVRRTLGIDRLGVTSSPASSSSSANGAKSTSAVEAGRYVASDVYVGVQQGLTTDSSRAKVEVGITDSIQAEVGVGVHADPQVGIKIEWDY